MALKSGFFILAGEMQKSKIKVFDGVKSYVAAFLMVSAYFLFQIVSFRYAVIFCSVGAVICFYHYRFSLRGFIEEFYPIKFLILSYIGVIIMALISIHFAFDSKATFKAICIFLLGPFFLTLMFYFVIKNLPQKALAFFFFYLGIIIFLQPLVTIYHYFNASLDRAVGFGDFPIIPYGLFLILAFSLSFSMVVYLKGKFRIFACLLFCMSLFAMYANGTRALIFSIVAMLLTSLVLFRNKIGKKITLLISVAILFVLVGAYCLSSHFSERFDFEKIFNHIKIVWSYAPAQMGRFDKKCFKQGAGYSCSKFSGNKLDERFSFESNSLNRLSLWKSAYIAIMKNPLIPNGFYSRFFNENLTNVIKIDSINYFYPRKKDSNIGYYTHIHNMILSFIFELGIIGFLLVVVIFFAILRSFVLFLNRTNNVYERLFMFCMILFLSGFWVSMFFDSMISFSKINYSFFVILGIFLGIPYRKEGLKQ